MPLFSSRKPEEEVIPEPAPVPEKKHGLFGSRHRSPSPSSTVRSSTTTNSRVSDASSNPSRHRSVLSRFGGGGSGDMDPSIVQARERVMGAETAEREADRALEAARVQVREARAEVKRLELEAAEEARRAKIKQYHAREVSKRGKQLGRHDL
ncbi:Uu.00g116740.m01.CDS01 [Anthostomella pinea]|uniref:Uu.00g116740.m01.CDS01 n=1 Tax=Anthostomella pinea TaxID=933095 RepID=A0AAI8VG43_9PEZI|nr:Uu.00g116740.m01.CDS01 [Anthostomella pinea]